MQVPVIDKIFLQPPFIRGRKSCMTFRNWAVPLTPANTGLTVLQLLTCQTLLFNPRRRGADFTRKKGTEGYNL